MSRPSHRDSSFSNKINTALVFAGIGAIRKGSTKDQAKSNKFDIATGQSRYSSISRKIYTAQNKIQQYDTTNSILVASPRESTRKKYNPYQQKWHIYCHENNINPPMSANTKAVLFLLEELESLWLGLNISS